MAQFVRFAFLCLTVGLTVRGYAAEPQLIEAEDFQFSGGWMRVVDEAASGKAYLQAFPVAGSTALLPDAVTQITVEQPGDYTFWARARDFASDRPGTRRFALLVDGDRLDKEGGTHGKEGFAWQTLGTRALAPGGYLLAIRDTTHGYGRCDALFVTRAGVNPGSLTPQQLARCRVKPAPLASEEPAAFRPARVTSDAAAPAASLESPTLRVGFFVEKDAEGQPWIVRRASLNVGGAWKPLPPGAGQETLFVQQAQSVTADLLRVPTWNGARVPVSVTFNGQQVSTCGPATDPYTAAPASRFVPREVVASDARSVELLYRSVDGQTLPVRWSLDRDDPFTLRVQARLTAPAAGFYSLGFCALEETARERVAFVQLPPLYQFQRLPPGPDLLCNTLTPHPLALAQVPWLTNGAPLCVAVSAEPEDLPFVWPDATNAVCGLGLLNSRAQVQPSFFSPVLGSPRSRLAVGETRTIRWRVMTRPAEWKATLEAYCANIMKVTDYREPVNASLSEAALNMMDLMMNDEFGGWNDELKGFYDIESATMGKHAAPLALLSAATLSRSEAFWAARALPAIEFMLSRKRADVLQSGVNRDGQAVKGQLRVPGEFYGTTGWEGVHRLTSGLNPWLTEIALPGGRIRTSTDYNSSWPWTERLAANRLAPSVMSLDEVASNADVWLDKQVYGRQTVPVNFQYFYNIHFYPYWWDVIDLYEATRDKRFLDAAEEGAFHTIAGLWSHPRVPPGEVTAHPGGSQVTYHPLWHKNDQRFRLGWPRQTNDTPERAVPAWQVSPVGLGLEQPSTYTSYRGAMNNIMQSTWAPHLLRVFRHTDREIYRTFARNSVIGRFANYPGYYLTCFTDRVHDPRYPYVGPDITSLYYHHIPVHFAFTVDYLLADAEARSGGQVAFPWVKQKNYAWFNSRVYTAEPGSVYGDKWAALWLERGVVTTDAKTDWLAARSPERFWVMLMNQTRAPRTVTAKLDRAKIGLTGDEGVLYEGDADPFIAAKSATLRPAPALKDGTLTVAIAPLSMVTIGYAAAPREEFPACKPLSQKHRTANAGAFGEAHVFTLRSPWGKDAVYAVLTADAVSGAKVTFTCEGVEKVCERFPYEASFYPVRDPAAAVRVKALVPGSGEQMIDLP
jgi:hypothetical protein